MNAKFKWVSVSAMVCIAVLLGYFLAFNMASIQVNEQANVQPKWQASVNVKVIRDVIRDGQVVYKYTVYEYTTHNILLTIGSTWVKDFLRLGTSGATNATDDIAVGNHSTPAVGDTKLAVEATTANLTRQSGTVTNLNATAYQVEYSRIASDTITINATSLHRDPTSNSDGNAVAIATITQASLIANDQIKVTWTINVPAG